MADTKLPGNQIFGVIIEGQLVRSVIASSMDEAKQKIMGEIDPRDLPLLAQATWKSAYIQ